MIKNDTERQRIGQQLADLRKLRGMSQQDVADHAGLIRAHISRIEQGRYSVGFDTLQAIADALDADIKIVPRE